MKTNSVISVKHDQRPAPNLSQAEHATTENPSASLPGVSEEPYSILSEKEKIVSLLIATTINFLPPMSGTMYYPALAPLSKDLGVSKSKINLTVTIFLVTLTSLLYMIHVS